MNFLELFGFERSRERLRDWSAFDETGASDTKEERHERV